jgi:hypothetical protein
MSMVEHRSPRRKWTGGALALTVTAAPIGLVAGAAPASAHSAGKAVVLIRSLAIAPMGTGWHATATIADFDSGAPLQGTAVTALTGSTTKPIPLAETATVGEYAAMLPGVKAGPVRLELRVRTVPGSAPVQPYDKTFPITLVAGQTNQVVSAGGDGDGGGSGATPILATAGSAVVGGALLYGLFIRRRRTPLSADGA